MIDDDVDSAVEAVVGAAVVVIASVLELLVGCILSCTGFASVVVIELVVEVNDALVLVTSLMVVISVKLLLLRIDEISDC